MNNNENLEKLLNSVDTNINLISMIFIFVILLTIFIYIYQKVVLRQKNCTNISKYWDENKKMDDTIKILPKKGDADFSGVFIDETDDGLEYELRLRDFYIKTAHNCCCNGEFKNDYVDLCSLENCAKFGVRALDFQIYSYKNNPVISASTVENNQYKEMYNHLDFYETMDMIHKKFMLFDDSCPNPDDPLFLIFRIHSKNTVIYDNMADSLLTIFGEKLLSKQHSGFENAMNGNNLASVYLSYLRKKVVIIVDKTRTMNFTSSKLYKHTNLCLGESMGHIYRASDLKHKPDISNLRSNNKYNMCLLLPDKDKNRDNYDPTEIGFLNGVQFIAMNFQMKDEYLNVYNRIFTDAGYAFAKKQEALRPTAYVFDPTSKTLMTG